MESILVLGAHPDDETLGLGGTIVKHAKKRTKIFALIFADGESARSTVKNVRTRRQQAQKAASILGISEIKFLEYRDQLLDTIPALELAKQVEKAIKIWNPATIYTHFWGDVNQDHRKVFEASLIACRPTSQSRVTDLICYETPSSTEWGSQSFEPNFFVNIEDTIDKKIEAFRKYAGELKKFPHPRSVESILTRSKYWGSRIGVNNAEAFQIVRRIVK